MSSPLRIRAAALAALAFWLTCVPTSAREWTNDKGQKLEARLVRVKDDTAFLRADGKTIPAPIDRLSQADQEWVTRYVELTAEREWGTAKVAGEFKAVRSDGFEVRNDTGRQTIPFADLTVADFTIVEEYSQHVGDELPEEFATEQAAAIERAPPPRPEGMVLRDWTDTRGRTLSAEFEGTVDQKALLWKGDKRFEFPLAKLSSGDRSWIANHYLGQLRSDLSDGVSAANTIISAGVMKAMMSGRRPPPIPPVSPQAFAKPTPPVEVNPHAFPETPLVAAEPTTPEPASASVADANVHPERGPAPWIDDVGDLSANEIDRRLNEAFGEWYESDEDAGGDAYCSHCDGNFLYPASFGAGDPCPFCGVATREEDLYEFEEIEVTTGGLLWWLVASRLGRRVLMFGLIAIVGGVVSAAVNGVFGTSGE
ncbi:MAG: hypothetical protein AAF266_10635 [Planctomycetota bacterium]